MGLSFRILTLSREPTRYVAGFIIVAGSARESSGLDRDDKGLGL